MPQSKSTTYSFKRTRPSCSDESGLALLLTVFVISFASILVLSLANSSRFDLRRSRNFAENVQANLVLKSAMHLGQVLIEAPHPEFPREDTLQDPWALVAAAPSLPISGFAGEARLMVVDEDSKISVNSILVPGSGSNENADFWKVTLDVLFSNFNFQRVTHDEEKNRTLGNISYEASDQVAVIHDWMDSDTNSHTDAAFEGQGIESSAEKTWFYNRELKNLSELLLVPGMTLERVSRIAPFVRVGPRSPNININTASYEVLTAMGIEESTAAEIIEKRLEIGSYNRAAIQLLPIDDSRKKFLKSSSSEFTIYCRVTMPNGVHWLRAKVRAGPASTNRQTWIQSVEFL